MVVGQDGDASGAKAEHVMELIKQFDFLSFSVGGKIHCSLTSRDLPLRVDAIKQHVNSKKLRKEREWYKADYSKYEPFIMPHKTKPKMLYCTLTGTELNRIPKQVEAHVNGKRFRSRKAEFEELSKREAKGEEPTAEEGSDEHDFWAPSGNRDAGEDDDVKPLIDRMSESGDDDDDGGTEEEKAEEVERLPSRTSKKSRNQNGGVQRSKGGGNAGAAEKKGRKKLTRKTGKTDAGVTASGVGAAGGEKPATKPGKKRGKHRVGASGPGVERCPEAKGMSVMKRKKGKGRNASSSLGVVGPLSDETPAVSNAIKTVPAPTMASASTQKNGTNKKETKNGEAAPHAKVKKAMVRKANKGKEDKGRIESATGNGAAPQERKKSKPNGGMTPASTTSSSNKRQHRIPDGQASEGKKKRLV